MAIKATFSPATTGGVAASFILKLTKGTTVLETVSVPATGASSYSHVFANVEASSVPISVTVQGVTAEGVLGAVSEAGVLVITPPGKPSTPVLEVV